MVIRNQYLSMQSREALFDIALVVYRVGSSGRESKANHPQTLIPLMIMEINLGSPQDASVAAPFHFSFHRCNDVPRVCLSFRLSSPLAPLALSPLFRRSFSRVHRLVCTHVLADRRRLSLSLPPPITSPRPSLLSSPFSILFHLRLAPPRPSGRANLFSTNRFSLPRSLFRVLLTCQSCAFDEYVQR